MMSSLSELPVVFEEQRFCPEQNLSLKPLCKIEITVNLPKITVPGQSISNWDLMERLKKLIHPIQMSSTRVKESSLEVVIFEAELMSRPIMKQAIKLFHDATMKVSGFAELLRITAEEAKSNFPSRHDWDLFFMKNDSDEKQPGERPDTIYLAKVPVKWFNDGKVDGPSEYLLKKAMSSLGKVRKVDIPICDPLRVHMPVKISGFQNKGFNSAVGIGQDVFFEAYVQYCECDGFTAAMDSLRNMKWLKKIDDKVFQADVKVDFDRSMHLSAASIERRNLEKEKLLAERNQQLKSKMDAELAEKEKQRLLELEKEHRRAEREERRRRKFEEEQKREKEERERELEKQKADKLKRSHILEATRLLDFVFTRMQEKEEKRQRNMKILLDAEMKLLEDGEVDDDDHIQLQRQALIAKMELKRAARQAKRNQDAYDRMDETSENRVIGKSDSKPPKKKRLKERNRSRSRSPSRSVSRSRSSSKKRKHKKKSKKARKRSRS